MEMENANKFLPIGSIVILNGAKRKIMVTGYKPVTTEINETGKYVIEWDYNGCIYPEGLLSTEQVLLFNHSQINQVFFMGYEDEESKKFHEALKNM